MVLLLIPTVASAEYYVKKGDTLWGISQKYNTSYSYLLSLNPHISNPNLINVGDYIVLNDNYCYVKAITEADNTLTVVNIKTNEINLNRNIINLSRNIGKNIIRFISLITLLDELLFLKYRCMVWCYTRANEAEHRQLSSSDDCY